MRYLVAVVLHSSTVPTTRPRHTFTETDDLREVIRRARAVLGDERSPKSLLREVIRLGDAELRRRQAEEEERQRERRAKLQSLADWCAAGMPGLDREALARIRHEGYPDDGVPRPSAAR